MKKRNFYLSALLMLGATASQTSAAKATTPKKRCPTCIRCFTTCIDKVTKPSCVISIGAIAYLMALIPGFDELLHYLVSHGIYNLRFDFSCVPSHSSLLRIDPMVKLYEMLRSHKEAHKFLQLTVAQMENEIHICPSTDNKATCAPGDKEAHEKQVFVYDGRYGYAEIFNISTIKPAIRIFNRSSRLSADNPSSFYESMLNGQHFMEGFPVLTNKTLCDPAFKDDKTNSTSTCPTIFDVDYKEISSEGLSLQISPQNGVSQYIAISVIFALFLKCFGCKCMRRTL